MKYVFDIRNNTSGGGGGGGVTNVGTGNGLTGGPITSTGVISLSTVGAGNLLANLTNATGPLLPHSLPDILDYTFDDAQGTILFRGTTAWTYLAPGTAGEVLMTGGAGANPTWAGGTGGTLTEVDTGTGLTGGPITSTGTISLADVADGLTLANTSGIAGAPTPISIPDLFDYVFTNQQGALIYRKGSEWTYLNHGTAGHVLTSGGAGADPTWGAAGSGSVTSVGSGTGLTGGPITSTGFLSLAPITNNYLLANISGTSAAPTPHTVSDLLDSAFNNVQGNILYRANAVWSYLPPGTAGQVLTTGGPNANPAWAAGGGGGSGTVTSVGTGTGLTGGPITTTGTLSLATVASGNILSNISGSTAAPTPHTLSSIMDFSFSTTQGSVMYRNASGWVAIAPGTAGQVLTTGGAAANPTWGNAGSGTVSSVATGTGLTGGTITTTGTISLATVASKYMLANTSGTTAAPTGHSVSDVLDAAFNNAQGNILYRANAVWSYLPPGAAGQVLTTNGPSANPAWASSGGSFLYQDTFWGAKNGNSIYSGKSIQLPKPSILEALLAFTTPTTPSVINFADNGTYTDQIVISAAGNGSVFLNAPAAKMQAPNSSITPLLITGTGVTGTSFNLRSIVGNTVPAISGTGTTGNFLLKCEEISGDTTLADGIYKFDVTDEVSGDITTSGIGEFYVNVSQVIGTVDHGCASAKMYINANQVNNLVASSTGLIYGNVDYIPGTFSAPADQLRGMFNGDYYGNDIYISNRSIKGEVYDVVNVTADYTVQPSDCNKALGIYNPTGTLVITLPSYSTSGPLPNGFRVYAWQGYEGGGAQFVVEGDDTLNTRNGRYTRVGKVEAILTSNSTISPYDRIWTLTGDLGGA